MLTHIDVFPSCSRAPSGWQVPLTVMTLAAAGGPCHRVGGLIEAIERTKSAGVVEVATEAPVTNREMDVVPAPVVSPTGERCGLL